MQFKQNQKIYAMKEMSKVKAYLKKSIDSIISERRILAELRYSLIANLNFSFQDNEYLFLVLDYLPGGDIRYYLNKKIQFSEKQIKFFMSNLLLSLKYIHRNKILHRDIKPDNLVLDEKGYLHLTDFGIAQKIKPNKIILSKSGTPGYISPELLLHKPQTNVSEYFSVGIICYELLFHKKPYKGKNKKEMGEKILTKEINIKKEDLPNDFSILIADFINKLLKRNDKERLGNHGIREIQNHPWFEGVKWNLIEEKLIDLENIPFSPAIGDNFNNDLANKDDKLKTSHYGEYLKIINGGGIFKDFYFNYYDVINPDYDNVSKKTYKKSKSVLIDYNAEVTEKQNEENNSNNNGNYKVERKKSNIISDTFDENENKSFKEDIRKKKTCSNIKYPKVIKKYKKLNSSNI